MDGFAVRASAAAHEVALSLDWAAAEGWNPGRSDGSCFFAADPGAFLIGELHGRPVAVISAVRYGRSYGFIGLYIVRPEFRGRGFGLAVWNEAMKRLCGRNVGLDGVPAQQDNYRKSGFRTAYVSHRYEAGGGGRAPGLKPVSSIPFEDVAALDRACFPEERNDFLRCWLAAPGHVGLADVDGSLRGFGVLRPCGSGHKIGPLIARDPDTAERLFQGLCAAAGSGPVYLDIPEVNKQGTALAERHGLSAAFACARMYTGPDPDVKMDWLYGVTTFELG